MWRTTCVKMPPNARGPISFTAKLNYRKFSWYYTQFAYAGQPKPGQDPALLGLDHNSLEYQFLTAVNPGECFGQHSRTASPICRSSPWRRPTRTVPLGHARVDARGAQTGSRALERLGHRPAAARRSERRRICLPQGDRGRAGIRRRLAQRGARADSGRRDRRRQAVRREGARDQSRAGPHLVLPGRDPEGRWRLRRRARSRSKSRARSIRATAWC